jgi:Tol biopolymer transport system component
MNRSCDSLPLLLPILFFVSFLSACQNDKPSPTTPDIDPPIACFAITPAAGTTETLFSFDASCSSDRQDPAGDLVVRWDWDHDLAWDTDWTASKTATHRYDASGRKIIHLEVKDTGGATASISDTLDVGHVDLAPQACFSIAPGEGTVATLFQVDAACSTDPDDDPTALEVRWDWESDDVWDTDWLPARTGSHRYPAPGRKALRLEVRDPFGLTGAAQESLDVGLDYVGQTPPGLTPEVFATGLISIDSAVDFACTFSPDGQEFYFTRRPDPGPSQNIYETHLVDGAWTTPSPVPFSAGFDALEPHVTLDNRTIYFGWSHSVTKRMSGGTDDIGIWAADRTATGWGAPRYVGPGMYVTSSAAGEVYVTDLSRFPSAIARATMADGRFTGFERIRSGAHPAIAPDGSYLVYDIAGGEHLMVCFRQGNGWGTGIDLTAHGIPATAGIAHISPDGKYLFYKDGGDTFWVSTDILENLRGGTNK